MRRFCLKYRGAAPINWAILNDEPETGVSIMYMAQALDAGDVLRVARTPIGPEEDLPSLWNRLAELGAQALSETIPTLADGTAVRHAPGRDPDDLRAHAQQGTLSHRLEPQRPGHRLSGPGPAALALRRGGAGRDVL